MDFLGQLLLYIVLLSFAFTPVLYTGCVQDEPSEDTVRRELTHNDSETEERAPSRQSDHILVLSGDQDLKLINEKTVGLVFREYVPKNLTDVKIAGTIRSVVFQHCPVGMDILVFLSQHGVQELELDNVNLTGNTIPSDFSCMSIKMVACTSLYDRLLQDLVNVRGIRTLMLIDMKVDGGWMLLDNAQQSLKKLYIIGGGIVHTSVFERLRDCHKLWYLSLDQSDLSKEAVLSMTRLQSVRNLSIAETTVSDREIALIAQYGSYEELDVYGCRLSDGGARRLADMSGLDVLRIDGARFSQETIDYLREHLQSCLIELD